MTLPFTWNLTGHCKSTMRSEVAQSCLTLFDPMDCSLPRSSVRGIFQSRVLEWVAISFSRGSSQPRDRTQVSRTAGRCFTVWATREAAFLSLASEFFRYSNHNLEQTVIYTRACYSYNSAKEPRLGALIDKFTFEFNYKANYNEPRGTGSFHHLVVV